MMIDSFSQPLLSGQELVICSIWAQLWMPASEYLQTDSGSLGMALINLITLSEISIRRKSQERERPAAWQQIRDRGEKLVRETFPEGKGIPEEISRSAMSGV